MLQMHFSYFCEQHSKHYVIVRLHIVYKIREIIIITYVFMVGNNEPVFQVLLF